MACKNLFMQSLLARFVACTTMDGDNSEWMRLNISANTIKLLSPERDESGGYIERAKCKFLRWNIATTGMITAKDSFR